LTEVMVSRHAKPDGLWCADSHPETGLVITKQKNQNQNKMEEQNDIKRLDQISKALALVGINTNVASMYAIEQVQKRVAEKGSQFSIQDAEEINADLMQKFPPEPVK